ncbi:hypothetical protein JZ751_012773 [Albula glossodonta]|uniref:Protein NPAT C-terminal domain-containing protein n=1 Tax=Albula glossodonta TaxID=121402 RepID=A0A8T2MZN9_9TELE|nr:hypothetical protein JZ751_012773 [Albula glossodonta]
MLWPKLQPIYFPKETGPEPQVPHMMTSLWKKLDFTLNQIKSLQNSPAVSQDPRGSEDFGSRLEEEFRISNRRIVLKSKGVKSRKMACPIPNALRAGHTSSSPTLLPITVLRMDTGSGAGSAMRISPADQERGSPHTGNSGSQEGRPLPYFQSQSFQGLQTNENLMTSDPHRALATSCGSRVLDKSLDSQMDDEQIKLRLQVVTPLSGGSLETSGNHPHSTSPTTLPLPTQWQGQPSEVGSTCSTFLISNTLTSVRDALPSAEGSPAPEATPTGTATPEALFTTAHMSFGPDPPSKIMISVDNVVICENQGGQQSYPASNQAVSRVLVSPLAQSLSETRPMERVANPETLVENIQAMSCLQGTEPLPAVKHTVLKGKEGQEPIRDLVTDTEENGKLPLPSLSQVGKEMVSSQSLPTNTSFGGCRKRTTVMNPALEVQWSEVTMQDTDKKLSVAAIQSVAPMKDGTTARSPSGTSPQGHRRMLCLEVSSGDTANSAHSPQRPNGATFRWISPPALENGRAEDSETTTERVKGVGTEEGLGKITVDEILNGNVKCSRSRGKDRVGGVESTMRLASFSRKVQAVDGEGKIQCGGGLKKGDMQEVRSKVRDGSTGKTQGSRGWEGQAETMSLPQPPFDTANKENELEGRSQARTVPPGPGESSPVSTHLPASLSPGCFQKTSSKTGAPVRQAVDPLQDIQQQSPTPTLSKSPPHPRTPTLESDRKATPSHLSRDPTAADTPTCSPAANMAAHTLMILSRATVAPLRDSSQQGAPQNSASNRKTHMQEELNASPAPSKELQLSANRTNAKRRKRLLDSFPDDLDVEKFLSSLHYDE